MSDKLIPFWNKRFLELPPLKSYKINHDTPARISSSLAGELENVMSVLLDLELLHQDAALISRLLFRTKKTLRTNKGYKCFQKVRQGLKRYLSLDLLSTVVSIRQSVYANSAPSKEALEGCLVSFLRFASLFHRIQGTCMETVKHMHDHISTGNNWHLAILFLACLSRVWTLSRYLVVLTCEWYLQIKPYLPYLEVTSPWLPEDFKLPSDLRLWLGNPDYLQKPVKSEKSEVERKKSVTLPPPKANVSSGLVFNEDLGEVVERGAGEDANLIQIRFEDPADIYTFLSKEQRYRKTNSNKCRTKKLSENEWKYVRNSLRKSLIETTSAKDAIVFKESLNRAQKMLNTWVNKS